MYPYFYSLITAREYDMCLSVTYLGISAHLYCQIIARIPFYVSERSHLSESFMKDCNSSFKVLRTGKGSVVVDNVQIKMCVKKK